MWSMGPPHPPPHPTAPHPTAPHPTAPHPTAPHPTAPHAPPRKQRMPQSHPQTLTMNPLCPSQVPSNQPSSVSVPPCVNASLNAVNSRCSSATFDRSSLSRLISLSSASPSNNTCKSLNSHENKRKTNEKTHKTKKHFFYGVEKIEPTDPR